MSQVQFSSGTYANYAALTVKDAATLYFTTDTHQIFVGSSEYTKGTTVLTAAPTASTPGEPGHLYAYNGNLYVCTGKVSDAYQYTRVANINDNAGTVTSITIGEGLTNATGDANPIVAAGTIKHAVAEGAAVTTDDLSDQTPEFGGTFNIKGIATDKFGHVTGVTSHTVTIPSETAVTVETATGTAETLSAGDSFTVVTEVGVGEADQSVKRTATTFTLPEDKNTTYTFGTGSADGTISVTPSDGTATDVAVKGLSTAAYATVETTALADDTESTNLPTSAQVVTYVKAKISDLEGAMHFVGVITRNEGETDEEAIKRVVTSPESGDVVVMADNSKEYIFVDPDPETEGDESWREVGDEGMYVKKTTTIAGVDLEDNITKSELLTALNVADGAQVNVLEGVQVNGSNLTITDKKVNVTVATGSEDGTVAVNGSDVAVKGLDTAAYKAVETTAIADDTTSTALPTSSQIATYVKGKVASLDTSADIALATASDGVVTIKAVKEVDGVIAASTDTTKDVTLTKVATTGKAEDVTIADTAGKITATTVEGALAEIAASVEGLGTAAKADVATVAIGSEGEAADALPTVSQVETYVQAALTWKSFDPQ